MIEKGLLSEETAYDGQRGRPSLGLRLGRSAGFTIALDFERSFTHLALSDATAALLDTAEIRVSLSSPPTDVLDLVLGCAKDLLERSGLTNEDVHQVVASIPAPVDFVNGVTAHRYIMPGWEGFELRRALSAYFDAPALVDNNANMMALGASTQGGSEQLPLLHLHLSMGIGAGLITADGKIHRGADGSAGDIGHLKAGGNRDLVCICGKTGCVGAVASLRAVFAQLRLQDRDSDEVNDEHRLRGLIKSGDPAATAAVRDAVTRLGELTAELVDMFNPRTIILGGEMVRLTDEVLAGIRSVVYRDALPIATRNLSISMEPMGKQLALLGAVKVGSLALLSQGGA
ncbi:ROK family protein [Arthrobacter sp. MMS18-M83]|uniref:ROK family protein n=1 Tax=Arthrobacter sp. MMS18-M83 TaxID=2996261 RepID=UPI00227AE949|nr:ROK family protein [Arthrobacter sp. MMS18-M83]WAH97298.1 ROK family protein [Arthrobacter sp. MMS18-M83]